MAGLSKEEQAQQTMLGELLKLGTIMDFGQNPLMGRTRERKKPEQLVPTLEPDKKAKADADGAGSSADAADGGSSSNAAGAAADGDAKKKRGRPRKNPEQPGLQIAGHGKPVHRSASSDRDASLQAM